MFGFFFLYCFVFNSAMLSSYHREKIFREKEHEKVEIEDVVNLIFSSEAGKNNKSI